MRRAFCLFAVVIIASYLLACHADWFTQIVRGSTGRNPLFSDPIDLRLPGTIIWKVPKEQWNYKKRKAQLSLALNLHLMREIPQSRSQVELKAKIAAYGVDPAGGRENRLVRDGYYTTDEPFSKDGNRLWESGGRGMLEFGLGAAEVRPGEDLVIEIQIVTPDPRLAQGNPRLKLVGEHDYAGVPIEQLVLAHLDDAGLFASLILLLGLLLLAWRGSAAARPPAA